MPAKYLDYYQTLGVERGASQEDIQRAYRKLARQYHPDVAKQAGAEQKFKEINEAYEVLKDPAKRGRYDELGANWKHGQDFRPPPGWSPGGGGFGADFGNGRGRSKRGARGGGAGFSMHGDFSDFFESIFGGGGISMDDFAERVGSSGGRGGRPARPHPGQTHEAEITISLADAFHGAKRHIALAATDEGGNTRERTYDVKIPAGVTEGSVIRLSGQGAPGISGGPPGDLLLRIHIAPDPRFRIDPTDPGGHNLISTLPITPWEAALGAKVQVPTIESHVVLTIPPGSQSGQKLRIRGQGLPKSKSSRGDLIAELRIVVPKELSPAEREAFERLAAASRFDPRAL